MCTSSKPFPSTSSLHIFQAFSSSKSFGFKSEKAFGEKWFFKRLVFDVQRFLEILSLVYMKVFEEFGFRHMSREQNHKCFWRF
jgi:hypothetical protein